LTSLIQAIKKFLSPRTKLNIEGLHARPSSFFTFSPTDGPIFGRIFAMALYAYEEGIPAAITMIKNEIKEIESKKPALVLESNSDKKSLN
jgi:hypothetical protein